jgi:molecular chaperone DnaK
MRQAGVQPGTFHEVLLVGGSTYMPVVEQMLRDVTKGTPSRELEPEKAVAQGAAIHAAILESREKGADSRLAQAVIKRLRSVQTSDVNSHSLGVKVTDPEEKSKKMNHIMIPRNTEIPKSVSQRFVTTTPNQKRIHVEILEGEVRDPNGCTLIGDFRVVDLPDNLPQGSPVEVTYRYDSSGRIHATAKELTSNQAAETEIVRDSGLSDDGLNNFQTLASEYHVE